YQREIDAGRKLLVGVNAFQEMDEKPLETLIVDDAVEKEQTAALTKRKAARDDAGVQRLLGEVRRIAATKQNLIPVLIEAAQARCTVGELMNAMADVFGRYDGAARW